MKNFIILIAFLSTSVFANDFLCKDRKDEGPEFTLNVTVTTEGAVEYLINGEDFAEQDEFYNPRSPFFKDWSKLAGYYPSIGDGIDGFSVTIIVNKFLGDAEFVNTAKFGMLDYRAAGPEGYYSVRYKCERQQDEEEVVLAP